MLYPESQTALQLQVNALVNSAKEVGPHFLNMICSMLISDIEDKARACHQLTNQIGETVPGQEEDKGVLKGLSCVREKPRQVAGQGKGFMMCALYIKIAANLGDGEMEAVCRSVFSSFGIRPFKNRPAKGRQNELNILRGDDLDMVQEYIFETVRPNLSSPISY